MALLKFLKGNYANLSNATITEGQILVCGDTGELFVDVASDKRVKIGDFITVANLAALEALDATSVPTSRLYYVEDGNILARSNGTTWIQVNKQPTTEELKTLLGLGSAAYTDASAYDAAGSAKAVRDYVGDIPEGYTEETIVAYINKKAEETLNSASGGSSESAASVLAALNTYKSENDPKVTANTEAIAAIKDGTAIDSFADVETELGKKVDKVEGYSLVSDTEIARLADVDNYDDTALAGRVTTAEGKITALETEVEAVDAKFASYNTTEVQKAIDDAQDARIKAIEDDYLVEADIANFETKENVKKVADDLAAYVESNDAAVALKADKSVVDAMYTNTQIDELVQGAKDYADANDADTKYGITYDSESKKIKLVEGGSEAEIDATDFIKDGMIETVALSEDGLNLVITWNTDSDKGENNVTTIPLTGLVDIYTGVSGDRIAVSVSSDDKISADLVAGSISKNYLDDGVQASLAKADSALQEHQDISHLATTEALNGVDAKFANYTTTTDLNAALDLKADKTQVATDIATAKGEAIDDAASKYEEIGVAQGLVDALAETHATDKAALEKAITDGDAATLASAKEDAVAKVKELADGAVATNATNIANLTSQLEWGSF